MNRVLSVVVFTSATCHNCKPMKETLTELRDKYQDNIYLKIHEVDTNPKSMQVARQWHVAAVPTVVLLFDGEEREKIIGFSSKQDVTEIVERNLQRDVFQEPSGGSDNTSNPVLCDISEQENG